MKNGKSHKISKENCNNKFAISTSSKAICRRRKNRREFLFSYSTRHIKLDTMDDENDESLYTH